MYSSPMGPSFAVSIILYYTLKAYDYIGAHSTENFFYILFSVLWCVSLQNQPSHFKFYNDRKSEYSSWNFPCILWSSSSSQILSPWLVDEVNSGIGLLYWPASLWSLAGRYYNAMPELTPLAQIFNRSSSCELLILSFSITCISIVVVISSHVALMIFAQLVRGMIKAVVKLVIMTTYRHYYPLCGDSDYI